jgi:hypothetical protein
LNCDGQAPAGTEGSLSLKGPEMILKSNRKDFNAYNYIEYEYSPTSAKEILQNDPPDRKVFSWEFSGMPSSLSPGDMVTIKITGSVKLGTPGTLNPAAAAGVRAYGLEAIQQDNAWANGSEQDEGTYKFRVPKGATSVTIEIGADYGIGTFARYKYVK